MQINQLMTSYAQPNFDQIYFFLKILIYLLQRHIQTILRYMTI